MDLFFSSDRSYQNRFTQPGWRRSPGVLRFFQVGIPIDPPICRELFPNVLRLGGSAQTVQEIVTLGLSQEAKNNLVAMYMQLTFQWVCFWFSILTNLIWQSIQIKIKYGISMANILQSTHWPPWSSNCSRHEASGFLG